MTSDLALTLSFEGIGLLTRVPGGWHLLGEVGLDSPDLAGELTQLRAQAVAVGGEDFSTTLVLPNDQIKYLTLPAGRMSEKKRRQKAEDALEAETPYRADQLVFDIAIQSGIPQVAAVARDTLNEAEAFAIEHAFNPVRFSAIPPEDSFASAPDFGDTTQARAGGIKVQADKTAILVVSEGPRSEPEPEPLLDAKPQTEFKLDIPPAPLEPIVEEAPEPEPEPVDETSVAPEAPATKKQGVVLPTPTPVEKQEPRAQETAKAAVESDKPKSEPKPATKPEAAATPKAASEEVKPPVPDAPKETAKPAEPAAAFASIRAQKEALKETKSAPGLSGVTRNVSGTNAPSIPTSTGDSKAPPLRFDPAKAVAGLRTEKEDGGSKQVTSDTAGVSDAETATFASARSKTKVAGPAPKVGKKISRSKVKKATKDASAQEKQKMTLFGARPQEVRGKPRHLGLILTTLLLVLMAIAALWATYATEDGLAGLFGAGETEAVEVAVAPTTASPEAVSETTAAKDSANAPRPETAREDVVSAEAGSAPELPATDAPLVVTVPDGMTPNPTENVDTALLEPLTPESITDSAEIEAMLDEVGDGNVDPVQAEARYAVTGIWQRAPEQPFELTSDSSDDIYIASVDRDTIGFDAVALPAPEVLDTDQPARAQVNPASADTTFDMDARGLVVATAEGALNPEGVMVFAGRPPIFPAAYPKRIKVGDEPQISETDSSRLAVLRPKLRPGDLQEQNERANFGGLTREELAAVRPKLRPENVKLADEKDTTPTQLAVAASPRPRLKPANIAQLAARAAPESTGTTTSAAAVPAAASVVPEIPTTASVARQATIKNAINLNKVNLIGVYGTSSNRRALVRLSSGRYKKVQVGDRIDGGRVSAISQDELHYTKGKRDVVLKMPKS